MNIRLYQARDGFIYIATRFGHTQLTLQQVYDLRINFDVTDFSQSDFNKAYNVEG